MRLFQQKCFSFDFRMNSKVAAYNGLDIDSQAGAVNPGEAVFGDAACGQVIKIN